MRSLFPQLQRAADADGSDAFTALVSRCIAAAQQYLIDVQAAPATAAETLAPATPHVRAHEHVLQGAMLALSVDGLSSSDRIHFGQLARAAARSAGLDHLVIANSPLEAA